MFLGIPISFIIFSSWAEDAFKHNMLFMKSQLIILTILLSIGVISFSERNRYFIDNLYNSPNKTDIIVEDWVNDSKRLCDQAGEICRKNHSSLVVIDNWMVNLDYMAPALDYPYKTLVPSYERRTWEMKSENKTVRPNFIFLPEDSLWMNNSLPHQVRFKKVSDDPLAYLVETDGRRVFDVLYDMNVAVRWH
jgi:hypothetical protein